PFGDAWYYVARVRWGSIEVEWIHDKVFMGYDTPNVKGFNMSDGYNFVLMNAVQKWGHWEARLGAGPVLVHPEGTVNGYYIGGLGSPTWRLGGIGFQASLAYRDELWGPFAYVVEGKITSGVVHLTYPAPVNEIYAPVTGYHLFSASVTTCNRSNLPVEERSRLPAAYLFACSGVTCATASTRKNQTWKAAFGRFPAAHV